MKKHLKNKQLISTISSSDSKSIASYVIAYKALGINKDLAVECMKELMKRKSEGDSFAFEDFIKEETAKIPQLKGTDYVKIIEGIQNTFEKR